MTESAVCSSQDSEHELQIPRDVHVHTSTQKAWLFKAKLTGCARGCCKSGRDI